MKRIGLLLSVLTSSIFLSGCSILPPQTQSGISVDTSPQAAVFIDDKQVGTTPYENKKLDPGEISLRLVPQATTGIPLASWEGQVRLTPGIQTVIRRAFGQSLAESSGVMLTFDKLGGNSSAISVVSIPDAASVMIDGQSQGITPLALSTIASGDHQIALSAQGYQDQDISARALPGYRLVVSAQLAQLSQPSPSPLPSPLPGASPSPSPRPTVVASVAPSVSPTPQASLPPKPYVLIEDTGTGFLRVRSDSSTSGSEVTRVHPGEAYPYKATSSDNGWYQIEYQPGSLGWVSTQYAKLVQ